MPVKYFMQLVLEGGTIYNSNNFLRFNLYLLTNQIIYLVSPKFLNMQSFSKILCRVCLATVVLSGGILSPALAQDLNAKLPKDPKVVKGVLPNGLTYYYKYNKKPEKKVELRLVVNTGSIMEDDDQQGLAHFMEHMNFNGTKNFQKNDLVSYLQSIGVEFGADLNAYTGFDETVYILPIPTDKEGNLDKGFQIIEDWAHNALLTDADVDGERGVVLEESRLGKGADDRMMKKYLPKLLNGSRYKDRLPIGKDSILKNFKYDVIRRFYKDWYRPDLQAVVVVGDIDSATAMKYIMKHFAGLKNPANERPRTAYSVPTRKTSEAMVLTDKEATNYSLDLIFTTNKVKDEITLNDYRNSILRGLVSTMWNRRLRDLSRSSNPPFVYASVSYGGGWARGYEGLSASAGYAAGGLNKAMDAMTAELLRAKKYGFTNNEMELAKKELMSTMEKTYNERNTTESGRLIWEYVRNFLEKEPIPGIENEYEYYKQMLPGVKVEELNKLVQDWMSNMNTFTLVTGPEDGSALPSDDELMVMTEKAMQQDVKPMEEKAVASSLLDKKPTPGKVVSQESDNQLNTTTYTLSNGIKVTLKTTDYKTDEIILKGSKKGGTANYGVADRYSAQFATGVVGAMGAGNFTPTDMEKVTAGKTIRANMTIGDLYSSVSGSSTVKDFEDMLQLMYLKMTAPRKDEALFEAYKTKQKAQLQFMSANPQVAFIDTMYGVLYKKNPLAPIAIPKPEYFDGINVDRSIDIYKNAFSTADGFNFFIVGNVDPKVALPLIETYIGSLPSVNKAPEYKDNGVRPVTGIHTVKFKKGKEQQSLVVSICSGETTYSEDADLRAQALADILNIKVVEDLREKLGGIYTGGYFASVTKEPYAHYSIGLQLPCGPENVDKLIAAANEVVANIKKNGPDQKDLDKVKSTWHEQHREKLKDNNYWTAQLEQVMMRGKDKQHLLDYDKWVDGLTTKDIQDAANKLFNGKNELTAILYPES